MFENVDLSSVIYDPYPYVEVDNVFPSDFFQQLLTHKIPDSCLFSLKELNRVSKTHYPDGRLVLELNGRNTILPDDMRPIWSNLYESLVNILKPKILRKFGIEDTKQIQSDVLYVRDRQGFYLNPHTDTNKKLLTCLFYVSSDPVNDKLGTSMYVPCQKDFECEKGVHHNRSLFDIHKTVGFEQNRMFAFKKTNNSFHGIEKIVDKVERDLIIFDLKKD